MSNTKPPSDYIQLGRLGKTFRLGEAEEEALFNLKRVYLRGVGEADIREVREVGGSIIVYLTKALTLESAKLLTNLEVYAPKDALPETEDDNLYLDEVVGQNVYLDGEPFGVVKEIQEAGLQELLVIEIKQGKTQKGEAILPFPAPYVRVEEDGVWLEDVPEGLLDLNS
jgi:16S rRNA processing protein RimM